MSDKDNNIFDLEGDALDEALMAAIEETEEEERAARELKAKENQERAEQARVTAIEQEERKAKIEKLRQSLPNEGRRYFLMALIIHFTHYFRIFINFIIRCKVSAIHHLIQNFIHFFI